MWGYCASCKKARDDDATKVVGVSLERERLGREKVGSERMKRERGSRFHCETLNAQEWGMPCGEMPQR
jgi:hypothetical protein